MLLLPPEKDGTVTLMRGPRRSPKQAPLHLRKWTRVFHLISQTQASKQAQHCLGAKEDGLCDRFTGPHNPLTTV
jgi:hypothetical protein